MAHILDSFCAAIDKHLELSDVEKMNYLNGKLKGEAARAISGLPLTEKNYRKATELLKERFDKTQNLTNAYMESLCKIHVHQVILKIYGNFTIYAKPIFVA